MLSFDQIRASVAECQFQGWRFLVSIDDTRPILQVESDGVCAETGQALTWRGRKWFLSFHMTRSEVVQTAFKAVLTALEHEAREAFTYRGRPIFGPHFDIDHLVAICDSGATSERTA
jgi:hypothetical protein